jgi:hypothetical protein
MDWLVLYYREISRYTIYCFVRSYRERSRYTKYNNFIALLTHGCASIHGKGRRDNRAVHAAIHCGGTRGIIAYSACMHNYGNKLGSRVGAHMSAMTWSCHRFHNTIQMMTKSEQHLANLSLRLLFCSTKRKML